MVGGKGGGKGGCKERGQEDVGWNSVGFCIGSEMKFRHPPPLPLKQYVKTKRSWLKPVVVELVTLNGVELSGQEREVRGKGKHVWIEEHRRGFFF